MRHTAALAGFATIVTALTISAPTTAADEGWEFHLTPYIWGTGIEGTVRVAGQDLDVDESFGDLIKLTEVGGSLHFETHRRPWGGFADVFYVQLEDEATGPLGGPIRLEMEQTIAELGGVYAVNEKIEALLGVRYQNLDQEAVLPSPIGTVDGGIDWLDGIVGARWTPIRTEKWLLWLRGDVGAGDSDLVWLAGVGGGYRFNETVALLGVYRYLDTDFEEDGFKWDIVQAGAALGVDFAW